MQRSCGPVGPAIGPALLLVAENSAEPVAVVVARQQMPAPYATNSGGVDAPAPGSRSNTTPLPAASTQHSSLPDAVSAAKNTCVPPAVDTVNATGFDDAAPGATSHST